jgi:hypothetical protein
MKKCPYCGRENPADGINCQGCQSPLNPALGAAPRSGLKFMSRFLPYFLSYSIIASGVCLYNHIMWGRNAIPFPPHVVILNTIYSPEDIVAKLVRAGVPKESVLGAMALEPSPWHALAHQFILYAVTLSAFLVLIKLFQKLYSR